MERSILNSRKKGFSLVTVLFLIVGISITLGGVAFNFVTEGKLQRNDVSNNNSLSAAEIGLETAKMWLENKLKNTAIPDETKKIDANLGSPKYCLKGFGVNDIDSIDTKNQKLSEIIDLNNNFYSNNSFEYFIENITDLYLAGNSDIEKKANHLYLFKTNHGQIRVYDKYTGQSSTDHPKINRYNSGWPLWTNTFDQLFIDTNHLYLLRTNWGQIRVYNKYTGQPSTDHPKINRYNSGWQLGTNTFDKLFIDGDYLYVLRTSWGQIRVYNKYTGQPSADHPRINRYNSGWTLGTNLYDHFFVDSNHLYLFKTNQGSIRVYDKYTGQPSTDHPKIDHYNSGWQLWTNTFDQFFIDNNHLYLLRTNWGQIRVYNKYTGQPSTDHPQINQYYSGWQLWTNLFDKLFIDGNYLYVLRTSWGQIRVYNKYTGQPSADHPRINRYNSGWLLGTNLYDHFFVDGNDIDTNYNYYSIYVCGYGANNSIKRIQSIISVETTNKIIKQISWKEVF